MELNDIEKRKLQNCNFVKCILMLMVVLCHSVSWWGGDWFRAVTLNETIPFMKTVSSWTGSFHVYGFVLVSGYLFYYLRNDLGKYNSFPEFIKNKIKRLIIPYWFVCAVWVIPITTYYYKYSWKDIFLNWVLGMNAGQLWFLLVLFNCYIVCWLLLEHFKNEKLYIGISLLCYIMGSIGRCFLPDIFLIFRSLQFIIFFVSGYLIRCHDNRIHHKTVLIFCTLMHIILFTGKMTIGMNKPLLLCYDLVFHIVSAVAAFEILQFIGMKVLWENSKIVEILIKQSMPIYLFHQQIIYFVIASIGLKTSPYLCTIICFLASVIGSILIGELLSQNRKTAFLIGTL